ncbi:hypothetical protein GBA52_022924 [Prunus armeniaca]|nr:hypothetical protein GBA52_022924 [Prunus armeniaca]
MAKRCRFWFRTAGIRRLGPGLRKRKGGMEGCVESGARGTSCCNCRCSELSQTRTLNETLNYATRKEIL